MYNWFWKGLKTTIGSIAKLSGQFDFCPKLVFWIELSIKETLLIYKVSEHNTNYNNGDSARITTHRQCNMSFMKKGWSLNMALQ
jgi:spore germination protein YaaH